jgi:hypothetical protein
MKPRYLNVDCVLASGEPFGELLDCLKSDAFLLWSELSGARQSAGLETKLADTNGPAEDLLEFLRIFDALPVNMKAVLATCTERRMDVGFESGESGEPLNVAVAPDVLKQLAQLGFELSIRIYPLEADEDQ